MNHAPQAACLVLALAAVAGCSQPRQRLAGDPLAADDRFVAMLAHPATPKPAFVKRGSPRARPKYRLTDLGPAGPFPENASAVLNDRGRAALALGSKPFLWRPGHHSLLPTPDGYPDAGVSGINDAGQVVGSYSLSGSGAISYTEGHAVLWDKSGCRDLGNVAGFSDNTASGINDRGEICGNSTTGSAMEFPQDEEGPCLTDVTHGFVWRRGKMTDLGVSTTVAINRRGQVAGTVAHDDTQGSAYIQGRSAALWTPTADGKFTRQDIPLLPGWQFSTATALGDGNELIGYASQGLDQTHPEAFFWKEGRITDLGPGQPMALNARGEIVGASGGHAVLWAGHVRYDLDELVGRRHGWILTEVRGINRGGQIVGFGQRHGETRAFLLTPQPQPRRQSRRQRSG